MTAYDTFVKASTARGAASKAEPLYGKKFGRWEVLAFAGVDKTKRQVWKCRCECGTVKEMKRYLLITGNSKSCGCFTKNRTHGMTNTRVFKVWDGMKERCGNPNNISYKYYGGRGIKVCGRWLTFENFLKDMGTPSVGQSLDRIDSDGDYNLTNCRWATAKEQMRNRRDAKYIEYQGHRLHWKDLADQFGINYSTFWSRVFEYGWSIERAIEKPKWART